MTRQLAGLIRRAENLAGITQGTPPSELRTPKQAEVAADTSRAKAMLCGRRAGKTYELMLDFVESMAANPGTQHIYIGLTRPSAKHILWEPFKRFNKEHKWGLKARETELMMVHPNGASVLLIGADKLPELEKARGQPFKIAAIDECGSHKPFNLEYLAEQVLEPGLMDVDGTLKLAGSPGLVPLGYWYEVTTGERAGWSLHHWTALENPQIQAAKFIKALLKRRKWNEKNPIYIREYLAQWVKDASRLVFAFDTDRNVISQRQLPEMKKGWSFVLAMDFGTVHSTAWVLLAYGPFGPQVFILKSFKKSGLAPSEAADITKGVIDEWNPDTIVGDLGGLGKAYAEEFTSRYGIAIKPANKQDKRGSLEFTSDGFRTGNILSLEENKGLHRELETLLFDERHEDIASGQDDHESEALTYGFKECPAYLNPLKPDVHTRTGLPSWVDLDEDGDVEPSAPSTPGGWDENLDDW